MNRPVNATVKLQLDFGKCTGPGICVSISPEFFETNDGVQLLLLKGEVEAAELSLISDAIDGCATEALPLVEKRRTDQRTDSTPGQRR